MANPLEAFKNLKPWQQGAVAVGGIVVVGGVVLYERKQKASAAATAAASTAAGTGTGTAGQTVGDMITDPTTGETYPADSVDPATGLTYGTEIQEYGSVAAADEEGAEAGDDAIEEGLTQTEYDEETGQGTGEGSATNADWVSEVEQALEQLGYSDTDIQQGLARYFSSSPQGTAADGTNLYQMMDTAIGEFGPPPSGTYALIKGGTTTPVTPAGNDVDVPNVVGRTDLDTAEGIITDAGLVPHAAGDSGVGNKGKVTSQSPSAGSSVSKGSSVTITYTVSASTTPAADVTVPNVVGRADLDTAEGILTAAGLKATASAASVAASKGNKGKVTSQSPKASTKVAKGATVTLVYTK